MYFPQAINVAAMILMAVSWTLTYLLMLRRGLKDAALGIPLLAFCANFSWEFIFSFVRPAFPLARYINYVWFLIDVGLLVQVVRFGAHEFSPPLKRRHFLPLLGLLLSGFFVTLLLTTDHFHDQDGIRAGFVINAMMSVLFIYRLSRRESLAGQSMYIGLFKFLGTFMAVVPFAHERLVLLLYIPIFLLDLGYMVALHARLRGLGIAPWARL